MKKRKVLSLILAMAMVVSVAAGCGAKQEEPAATEPAPTEEADGAGEEAPEADAAGGEETGDKKLKLGISIQTLGNQVWAQQMAGIQENADADGFECTIVDCNENANTQLDQIENFITAKCDVIMVNPVDPDAIEDVCKKAREAGIKVVCWDNEMENTDVNWVIRNRELGEVIGTEAANWINETFADGKCEVAVLGYPQTPILLEREEGILAKLEELAPNAEVVANQPAINPTEGLNAMETILQAHPDVKVVCCIGGGGAAGSNEAFKGFYGSEVPEDVGVFAADCTDEEQASMKNGEFNRMSVAITGSPRTNADVIYDIMKRVGLGETMDHNVYRDLIPVTADNIDEVFGN